MSPLDFVVSVYDFSDSFTVFLLFLFFDYPLTSFMWFIPDLRMSIFWSQHRLQIETSTATRVECRSKSFLFRLCIYLYYVLILYFRIWTCNIYSCIYTCTCLLYLLNFPDRWSYIWLYITYYTLLITDISYFILIFRWYYFHLLYISSFCSLYKWLSIIVSINHTRTKFIKNLLLTNLKYLLKLITIWL